MFDKKVDKKILLRVGFADILTRFGSYEYLNAMEELRTDVLFKMRNENLKFHLLRRNISRRDRLTAYIQYFVE